MSLLSREEMLRELELLPMWQLRHSSVQPAIPKSEAPVTIARHEIEENLPSENPVTVEMTHIEEIQSAPSQGNDLIQPTQVLRMLLSDDARYAILIEPSDPNLNSDEEQLLNNMLRAMRIQSRKEVVDIPQGVLATQPVSVIICMGERPANLLLQQSRTITQWRDEQYVTSAQYRDTPLIVTFPPAYLLTHSDQKALAWRDLCLAMSLTQQS